MDPQDPRSWVELLFLSFTTLTSTGLSDVVPVKAFARSLVGVLELWTTFGSLALVVALFGARPRRLGCAPDRPAGGGRPGRARPGAGGVCAA